MKVKLHELKDAEIATQLKDASKELREQRFQFAVTRSLENPKKIRNLKKKIARLMTIQREREIAASKTAEKAAKAAAPAVKGKKG